MYDAKAYVKDNFGDKLIGLLDGTRRSPVLACDLFVAAPLVADEEPGFPTATHDGCGTNIGSFPRRAEPHSPCNVGIARACGPQVSMLLKSRVRRLLARDTYSKDLMELHIKAVSSILVPKYRNRDLALWLVLELNGLILSGCHVGAKGKQ